MVYISKRKQILIAVFAVFSLVLTYFATVSCTDMGFDADYGDTASNQRVILQANVLPTIDMAKEELTITLEKESSYHGGGYRNSLSDKNVRILFMINLLRNMVLFSWIGVFSFSEMTATRSQKSIIQYIHHKDGKKS